MELWDVIAVNIQSGEHRVLESGKSYGNANAIMNMAIVRRGLDVEFYKLLRHKPARAPATDHGRME